MSVICIRLDWDRTAVPLPRTLGGRWHAVHVAPEPGWPAGRRGLALASAWEQYRAPGATGLLMLDGDVVIDPVDYREMQQSIASRPEWVWVAPIRLWPASTGLDGWVWGHWAGGPQNRSQQLTYDGIKWWGLGFTYLPRALITGAMDAGLRKWVFPHVDTKLNQQAQAMGTEVGIVPTCEPKHLNY